MAKVWAITVDGHQIQVWDLPIEDIEAIAVRHDVNWLQVIDRPMASAPLAQDLVEHAAKKLGLAVPVIDTARALYEAFDVIDDDLPVEYANGIPKAGGEATTG